MASVLVEGTKKAGIPAPVDSAKLARDTAFNLAGQVLPLLAGIALIPYIMRGLGPDRFGMLGIMWVVFGYFGLVDLGLGRATTKFLAEWLAKGEADQIYEMVWSSIILQVLLGVVGWAIIAILTPVLVGRALKTPASLMGEARSAFYVLAAALPAVLAGNGLRAVLEGCQRFDISNLLRIPSSILSFVIPAVGVAAGLGLRGIVLWLGLSRIGFAFAHGFYCLRVIPGLKRRPLLRSRIVLRLLSFGGWVTMSNLVNPILVTMDRFLIGSLLSVAMVGYYTAPYEAVTKFWVIPASIMTTVYPACSGLGTERLRELQILYSRSIKYIFCALAPVTLMLVVFARPLIGAWLGPGFVDKSAVPLQLLAIGVFINCFAHVPYSFLQGLGRPDTTAKLFFCELIPYGLLVWWMVVRNGIAGAAAAWSIRVTIEVALLLWIAWQVFSLSAFRVFNRAMWTAFGALIVMGTAASVTYYFLRDAIVADASVCALLLAGFAFAVWKWVLDGADRASALAVVRPLRIVLGQVRGRRGIRFVIAKWGRASGVTGHEEEMNADRSIEQSISVAIAEVPELEFTGERIVPGKTAEALFREHEERYVFAAQYVLGKDVLDVACGTGVGTSFLRRAGSRSAWGLDIDPDVIAFAKARYGECQFAQSDATNLSLPANSMDVVVSFETLEHLKDQRKFFQECRRVLRPGGLFVCSTPNTTIYRWHGTGTNPYHVRELATREFVSLLKEHFSDLALFSQAQRLYPLYVLRQVISRSLDRLNLKGQIKICLGMKEQPRAMREEFSTAGTSEPGEIRPYQGTWFKQPTYLVAIAHKSLD